MSNLLKKIPFYQFIQSKLKGKEESKQILLNSAWLFADKVFRLGLNFLLNAWIARYLGAEQFGIWNYALAFAAIFSVFSTMGLYNIVIRDIVDSPEQKNDILGAAFLIKFVGGFFTLLTAFIGISFIRPENIFIRYLVMISSIEYIFRAFDIIDYYFQSAVKAKFVVYARTISFCIVSLIKVCLILYGFTVIYFAWAALLEIILAGFFMAISYQLFGQSLKKWRIKITTLTKLLKDSFPLLFAEIAIVLYMRIDQIMVGDIAGDRALGTYSAAVRLSELWYYIPLVLSSSFYPSVIQAKKTGEPLYLSKLQSLYDIMSWLGISVALTVSFLSGFIVELLYGDQYASAAPILTLHIWAGVFVFLEFAGRIWLTVENLQKYIFYRILLGTIINLFLNYLLIPVYSGIGAAIATLISQFIAYYFANCFSKKTIPLFKMQSWALLKIIILHDIINFALKKNKASAKE